MGVNLLIEQFFLSALSRVWQVSKCIITKPGKILGIHFFLKNFQRTTQIISFLNKLNRSINKFNILRINIRFKKKGKGPLKVVRSFRMTDHGFQPPLVLMKTLRSGVVDAGKLTIAHRSYKKNLLRFCCTSNLCAFSEVVARRGKTYAYMCRYHSSVGRK